MEYNYRAPKQNSRQYDTRSPAECFVGEWGPFSPCNPSCGPGVQTRSRTVWNKKLTYEDSFRQNDNPNDKCGRIPREDTVSCNETDCKGKDDICFQTPRPLQCQHNLRVFWYYNHSYNDCQIFYDGDCKNNINRNKFSSQEACKGMCLDQENGQSFNDLQVGDLRLQPVDCLVSDWQTTLCNATCGTGYQRKTRKILRQARHGGKPCPNRMEKIYKCWVQCPMDEFSKHQARSRQNERQMLQINCEYSNWSPWTPCSKTCGDNGRRQRTRLLLNPEYNSRCRDRLQSELCLLPPCSFESCEGMFC